MPSDTPTSSDPKNSSLEALVRLLSGAPALLALLALVAIVQLPGLFNGFVYDDDIAIRTNPLVTDARFADIWTSDIWGTEGPITSGTYRPVMVTSFAAQWWLTPNAPLAFHFANLLFLLAIIALGWRLLTRLVPVHIAWVAAALFALHPVNSEVAHSIVQRSELLSAGFIIGALLLLLPTGERTRTSAARLLGGGVCFALALFSKENAIVLPLLLIALTWFQPGRRRGFLQSLRLLLPSLVLFALVFTGYWALRLHALGEAARPVPVHMNPTVALPDLYAHLNSGWLVLMYLGRYLWPFPQPMEWVYNQLPVFGPEHWPILLAVWIALALLAALTVLGLTRRDPAALGLTFFAIAIAPVVQALVPVTVLFADRTLFLGSLGLSLAAASLIWRLTASPVAKDSARVIVASVAGLLLLFAAYQLLIAPRWHDNLTLFSYLAKNSPDCENVQAGYGKHLWAAGRLDEADAHLTRATEIAPYIYEDWFWLGRVRLDRGRYAEGLKAWRIVIEHAHPSDFANWKPKMLALADPAAFAALGPDPEAALGLFDMMIELDPERYPAYPGRTLALLRLDRPQKAKEAKARWLERFPDNPDNDSHLATMYRLMGAHARELEYLNRALARTPDHVGLAQAKVVALARLGRLQQAGELISLLLQEHPENRMLTDTARWLSGLKEPEAVQEAEPETGDQEDAP